MKNKLRGILYCGAVLLIFLGIGAIGRLDNVAAAAIAVACANSCTTSNGEGTCMFFGYSNPAVSGCLCANFTTGKMEGDCYSS
jgi:hypothetical protein